LSGIGHVEVQNNLQEALLLHFFKHVHLIRKHHDHAWSWCFFIVL